MIGDLAVHYMSRNTSFAKGLLEYYKSLGNRLLFMNTNYWKPRSKIFSSMIQGAIWGGIACVIALLIAKLFLYLKELNDRKD